MPAKKTKMDFSNIKYEMSHKWDTIASDIFAAQGMSEEGGGTMSRKHVIEIVLDQIYGQTFADVPAEEMAAWNALSSAQRKKVAAEEFTYKRYGY